MTRLVPASSILVVVDVQEKLCAAMPDGASRVIANIDLLVDAARLLGAHVIASEQYPKGLGPTVEPLGAKLPLPYAKLDFSALADPAFARAFDEAGARDVVLVGMESHVCVFQTARDLVARGCNVHVVQDAVCSRTDDNRRAGIALCAKAGAIVNVTEAIVFDWLGRAGSPEFKELSKRIR